MNSISLCRYVRRARLIFASVSAAMLLPTAAHAAFHAWQIRELYTNLDGSTQFIELFTTAGSQQFTNGQIIQVTEQATGTTHTFMFPSNTPDPTDNHAILIATSDFVSLGGPTPDFILPMEFLFSGASTMEFVGTIQGPFSYSGLPTDGINSLAIPGMTTQTNNPENYKGAMGSVPEPAAWSMLAVGGLVLCFLLRRRATSGR